jgi:tRNA nucleotidyltransferase/poly(A) polymerase
MILKQQTKMDFTMNVPKTVSYSSTLKIYNELRNQFKDELEKREKEIVELKAVIKQKVSLMLENWETMNDKVYAEKKKKELETRNAEFEKKLSELETRNDELETRNAELETRNLKFEIDLDWYNNQYSRYRSRTSTVILDEQAELEAQLEVKRAEGLV